MTAGREGPVMRPARWLARVSLVALGVGLLAALAALFLVHGSQGNG